MIDALVPLLRERQAPDGGWGAREGIVSSTECTALTLMALAAAAPERGEERAAAVAWLDARQNADGGWPLGGVPAESTWVTSLALMALRGQADLAERRARGLAWILGEEGAGPTWWHRLREFLRGQQDVELDFSVNGWPWASGTFSWVEPTSYGILVLRGEPAMGRQARGRVEEAQALLRDRACPGGGWNYGNKRVLGVDIEPYPDTTALALLALQRAPRTTVVDEGLAALDRMVTDPLASGLALALGTLARRAWGLDASAWLTRLETRFAETGFLGETRTLALAALAAAPSSNPFLIGQA